MTDIEYELVRSKRKTVAIEIKPDGTVVVRAPRLMSKRFIDSFIAEKQNWIETHREQILKRRAEVGTIESISESEKKALSKQAKSIMPDKIARYAQEIGVTYGRVSYRFQRGRWGSCSSKGNLNFNCMLILTNDEIIDYVIVHELCHRLEMNHSAVFWKHVEQILPDYIERRKWLKENGGPILARLDATAPGEEKTYYTYMVRCNDDSLYVGYTPDLKKRLRAHNNGTGAKYTKYRRPVELVYYEEFKEKRQAQSREVLLKQLSHNQKEKLIFDFSKPTDF
jgi:predicted metal-dependent hydrolase/predicted GIY-YIG superfamily endonuclease